jgi:AcrR family transcriptional regulator
MSTPRRSPVADSATRTALLDAAEQVMLSDGYAAVTTRRLATEAGVNSALVHYYFGSMDGLFIALFRRRSDRTYERLTEVVRSPQPLWSLWDLSHDFMNNTLTMEFIALAGHRKQIRAEIAASSEKYRVLQVEALTGVLAGYGVDLDRWPAAAIIFALMAISRFLHLEESFDLHLAHAEMVSVVEREIRSLEGERRAFRQQA